MMSSTMKGSPMTSIIKKEEVDNNNKNKKIN
jgi:hypothetical protein